MPTNRRDFLSCGGYGAAALAGATLLSSRVASARAEPSESAAVPRPFKFTYALNTGTIRGQKLGLIGEIEVTAKAGYQAIEPWLGTIHDHVQSGGSLRDVRQRCQDLGLKVCSGIGFAAWIVDNETERRAGLEQLKRDMEVLAQIGGTHIAASPAGANRPGSHLDLDEAAVRYAAILELGREMGVIPQLEIWGSSANLNHGSQALYVAAKSGHPDACVLLDAYHMYKGGTPPSVLKLLGRQAVHCFHMNDYPADPPRATISDADRMARRRHRLSGRAAALAGGKSLRGRAVAGIVQPRVLAIACRASCQDGIRKDESRRRQGRTCVNLAHRIRKTHSTRNVSAPQRREERKVSTLCALRVFAVLFLGTFCAVY